MKLSIASAVYLTIWCFTFCVNTSRSQGNTVSDDTFAVSSGLSAFATELLAKTSVEGGDQLNLILSTYSIWNLLAILNEGAGGSTANQLRSTLRLPIDNTRYKFGYKNINRVLMTNKSGVELNVANAIFTDKSKQINKNFEYQTSSQFNVNFLPVDFSNTDQAARYIDSFIAKATNNRIKHFINFEDLDQAQLLLTTAIYFKGQWSIPFNKTATQPETFYDENMRPTGKVQMMYQSGAFPYARLDDISAHAVALPYGKDESYWMILVMPMEGIRLSDFLLQLTRTPFTNIINKLEEEKEKYPEDEVFVYLPKFKMTSDFTLNVVLEQMGMLDVFNSAYSDLSKIADGNLVLSRVIHKAEIEINEEGTVASGATGGTIYEKMSPPEFRARRPFLFFIVEKTTNTMLFAGKVVNPNDLN